MIIIIDAYNLLKQLHDNQLITDDQRASFLKQMKKYADHKKHTILVVFDGGPFDWTHSYKEGRMKVFYSGRHETADQVIEQYLDDHQTKDILLVSSDHELCLYASQLKIPSIGSSDFYAIITQKEEPEVIRQVEHISADSLDLDTLMEQASKQIPIKQEDYAVPIPKPSAKASKRERKLWQKLKKL